MYKIQIPPSDAQGRSFGQQYYDTFVQSFRDELRAKLSRRQPWSEGFFQVQGSIRVKLDRGSKAERFIQICINNDRVMRILLFGDLKQQLSLWSAIRKWVNDDTEFFPLDQAVFTSILQAQQAGGSASSHFHTVIKHIFEKRLYNAVLRKDWIVSKLKLEVCPYCGEVPISRSVVQHIVNGKVVIKPELDHFLPKSLFPYFAVNVFNLIPCCDRCNNKSLKGNVLPIYQDANGNWIIRIMHPYGFDNSAVWFSYIPPTVQTPEFQVVVNYVDDNLEVGYNNVLGIQSRYEPYNKDVEDMHERMVSYLSDNAIQYSVDTFGLPKRFERKYVILMLSFNPWKRTPSQTQKYKFLSDIYAQLTGSSVQFI